MNGSEGAESEYPTRRMLMRPEYRDFLFAVGEIVEQNYADRTFGMHQLALELDISDRQVQRMFRKLVGQTPSSYLREFRLKKSRDLLRSRRRITEVALMVGFSSHAYFSNCFRARFGMTPSRFRDGLWSFNGDLNLRR